MCVIKFIFQLGKSETIQIEIFKLLYQLDNIQKLIVFMYT